MGERPGDPRAPGGRLRPLNPGALWAPPPHPARRRLVELGVGVGAGTVAWKELSLSGRQGGGDF